MGKSHTDPYGRSTLRGNLDKTDIDNREVAEFARKAQPPCGACGRITYKLNAKLDVVCRGCDEADVMCSCAPITRSDKLLVG